MSFPFLLHEREKQLKVEEKLDQFLKRAKRECSCEVFDYLFNIRALNRKLTERFYKASFYTMPHIYSENLHKMNQVQEDLIRESDPTTLCTILKKINARIQSELKNK